jgi:hypothetical protein
LAPDVTGDDHAFFALEATQRALGLFAHHTVDRPDVVAAALQRLLDLAHLADLLRCRGRRARRRARRGRTAIGRGVALLQAARCHHAGLRSDRGCDAARANHGGLRRPLRAEWIHRRITLRQIARNRAPFARRAGGAARL